MKYLVIFTIVVLMFPLTSLADCWNDSECPSDKVCECPSSSGGNCDSVGTCVPRNQGEATTNEMKMVYEPVMASLEKELRFVSSSTKKALSTTESSSSSCSGQWNRMKNNLRSQAKAYCSNNVKNYGSMNTHQDKRSKSLYFCTVETVVTCN